MSAQDVGHLHFVESTVNTIEYQNVLGISLLPSTPTVKHQNAYTFQQDGASCHTAKTAKAWFNRNQISTMEWQSRFVSYHRVSFGGK